MPIKKTITKRDGFFPYLLISVFFHFIFIYFAFYTRKKPVFLSVPVEVSFYSKPQDELVDQSEVLTLKKKARFLDVNYENKVEIVNNHNLKEAVIVKKEKLKNYGTQNLECSNNVGNFQSLSSTNTSTESTSQHGILSFDTHDFKYSYYAGEVV
ncbi:MAG: hypothetical protein LBQ99_01295, partial [Endomicrobium sp.]|nr:hypothetical protein [Endomicrobium sp.]